MSEMLGAKEYFINEFLSLRLEGDKTMIYLAGEPFRQCKRLMLTAYAEDDLNDAETFQTMDDVIQHAHSTSHRFQMEGNFASISPEEEFMAHCSNLQAWHEHDYDTRILDSLLAFPILKRLTQLGDAKASRVFKKEIAERLSSGHPNVIFTLNEKRIVDCLAREEFWDLFPKELQPLKRVEELVGDSFKFQGLLSKRDNRPFNGLSSTKLSFTYDKINEEGIECCQLRFNQLNCIKVEMWNEIFEELSKIDSLIHLEIENCIIPEVSFKIGLLTSLKKLYLSKNEIKKVPNSIGNLTRLQLLDLSNNNLIEFPDFIEKLPYLNYLALQNNDIESIPSYIKSLKHKICFGLSGNKIEIIPDYILKNKQVCKSVKYFKELR